MSGSLKLLALHKPAVFDDLGSNRSMFRHIVTHDAEVTEQNLSYIQEAAARTMLSRSMPYLLGLLVYMCVHAPVSVSGTNHVSMF